MEPSSSPPSPPGGGVGFVGVHIGAGQHSEARTPIYLSICSRACAAAVKVLRQGGGAVDAAAAATVVLEDAGETNAGYGSNLTESGTVEMDAGIMDGSNLLFGAVGAMPGIRNPVEVARLLVREQTKGLLPLGRVPPIFMVGEGARDWAVRHGMATVKDDSELISEKANKLFRHYKKKLDSYRQVKEEVPATGSVTRRGKEDEDREERRLKHGKRKSTANAPESDGTSLKCSRQEEEEKNGRGEMEVEEEESLDDRVTDTVGVVVMDVQGNVASTVSSGGIALKQPGRVGQASIFGCGCWAQNCMGRKRLSVGVSTTGCGEHLVRTFLARECAQVLADSQDSEDDAKLEEGGGDGGGGIDGSSAIMALKDCMSDRFAESEFLCTVPEKLGGAICLRFDRHSLKGEFLWTHTTSSMGLAFQTTNCAQAVAKMSRLPPKEKQEGGGSGGGGCGGRGVTSPTTTTILVESVPFSAALLQASVNGDVQQNGEAASSSSSSSDC